MKFKFSKKQEINTDGSKIEEILNRSVSTVYPSKDDFKKLLLSGKQLRIYVGIDPTATYVHLGHSTNYIILKRLHELGHKIIVLVGDFTAMIGDPSDKNSLRKQLTKKDVVSNLKTFKQQIGKILPFKDKINPIDFVYNSKWLGKLNFNDLVNLASKFTVQQMIERDAFQKRIKEQKPLYVHEFFYPLMQGYDSVALKADVEIGGTDQTFNMLAGRILVKDFQKKEKMVMTTTLLENPLTGEKLMSKSLGTGIALNEDYQNMFGKVMRFPDEALLQVFTDCTNLSLKEIEEIKNELKNGVNPRNIKLRLAKEIVSMYHGAEEANKAEQDFINTFSKGGVPENVLEIKVLKDEKMADVLLKAGTVESKGEWRRLVLQGGVSNAETDEKIESPDELVKNITLKVGKKRFVKLVLE
ncbi:MAG: tyrosine--tRNA ligase [bacterium]